jgi:hypothetical protein
MNLHWANLPRLMAERRISVMLGMIIIAVLWLGIGLKYLEDASSDLREAERANKNFAMVFEESVLRSVGEVDKALLYLRHSVETRMETSNFDTIVDTTDVLSESSFRFQSSTPKAQYWRRTPGQSLKAT